MLLEGKLAGNRNIDNELAQISDITARLDNLKASLVQEFNSIKKSNGRVSNAEQHFVQKHTELTGYLSKLIQKPEINNISQVKALIASSLPESMPREELTPHICALTREPKIIEEPEREGNGKDRGSPDPVPEDTMETQEIQFTPRIQALAESLEYDPRKIYEYVRNKVHYQPYFGATRTAQSVLLEQTGNDFDQSTLLIALLRVSGIPARYGYGIIDLPLEDLLNLLNVDSLSAAISVVTSAGIPYRIVANGTRVWLKHCFVKAYVPVAFYRGAMRDDKNEVWISYAPAYKRYDITEAFDVITEMDFDALGFFEEYIKNGRTIDPMILYKQKIEDYLAVHHPGMIYESIRRITSITQEQFDILPFTTQPYLYYVYDEFSAIPDSFRQHVRISVFDEYNNPSLDTLLLSSELSGRRITLFYCGASAVDSMWIEEYEGIFNVPPYLLRLLPVLAVDGAIVKIGSEDINMAMVHDLRVEFINEEGSSETVNRELVAGAVHGLGMGMYSIGVPLMFDILPTDTLGCDTWIGKFSHDVVKRFFNDYDVSVHELVETNHAIIVRGNIFLACATQHDIEYIYGAPYTFEWTGYELLPGLLRLGAIFTDGIDNRVRKNRLRFLSGMCWSHASNQAILMATGTEAIDPMKLLTLSDSTMIPVYKITKDGVELLDEQGGRGASSIRVPDKVIGGSTAPSFTIKSKQKYVPQELIVKFKSGGFEENKRQINLLADGQIIKTSRHNICLLKVTQPLTSLISELEKNPLVEYASFNYYVRAFVVPNDPHFTNQWHMQRIAAPAGWNVTIGDSSVVISILDTGIDPEHTDFAGRIIPGYDFVNDDPEPEDDNGHGTHVAGIAGAATNNSIGIAGADWQAKVMPLKVLDAQGIGTTYDVCEGIYYAADLGADIINLSLGGYDSSPAYDDAVNYAHASGCLVIAAAGNDNTNQPVYPGACAHVICVSATNKTDQKASFSNFGTYIDLAAPGVGILSTLPKNQYTYYNGTSMSAPLVSGLAGLLCAQNPLFGPAEIESLLFHYADDLGEPGWDEYYGYGRINVLKSLVGPMPVVLGYYGNAVLGDGVATQGEQFGMLMSVVNTGDSTAYGVRATLSTSDPYVTIVQDFCRFGDIEKNQVIVGIDTFIVQFKSTMPKDHKVRFALTIEDSLGIIYADGFMIKEGEYLPGFIAPEQMKDLVRGYVNQGYYAYLPQGNLIYKDFLGTGFAANDLGKMDGQGGSAWYTYDEWWERFGASCVHIFYLNWYYALSRYDELLNVEVEVNAPEYDAAFPVGDTISIGMSYQAEFSEEPTSYSWSENLIWNTSEPPNMGGEWEPSAYQFWPVEYSKARGFYYEENESRIWWLFTFEILENLVKKYFNPLKPDSARVVYQILPMQYGDPDTIPNPIKMEVEIRDKDSMLVYGPRELSIQEQKDQVLFWDGRDNTGEYTDPDSSPYLATIKLTYREAGDGRQEWVIRRSTTTNNAPAIVGVPILTRIDDSEIPTSKIRYLETPGDLRFSTVVLCKVNNTNDPLEDYQCYHPNPFLISPTVKIYDPEWPAPHEYEFEVKQWRLFTWGFLSHLRWCEVRPKIEDDNLDKVGYADSLVLGNWIYDNGFGWKWGENTKEMLEGTLRYRVHVENWEAGRKLQEATTPKGIDLFRVSTKGDYTNNIVQWASSYIDVPYVLGIHPNEYGQNIIKGLNYGYEGLECSGLVCWAYIRDGELLKNLNPDYPDDTVKCVNHTDCGRLHGYKGQTQHVVIEDTVNSDNDVNWDGWDDADFDKDKLIEPGDEIEALERKLKIAQDGDMWFIDWYYDGLGENACPDHVGIFFTRTIGNVVYNRIIEANANIKFNRVITTDSYVNVINRNPDPKLSSYWNGSDERSIFRGLRRRIP